MSTGTSTFNSSQSPGYSRQETSRSAGGQMGQTQFQPVDDLIAYATSYARENPGTAALWCFGLGFIVGWRLKPW